jgi:hypothetical protein
MEWLKQVHIYLCVCVCEWVSECVSVSVCVLEWVSVNESEWVSDASIFTHIFMKRLKTLMRLFYKILQAESSVSIFYSSVRTLSDGCEYNILF